MPEMLRVRLVADKSRGQRILRWDPETGEKMNVNPDTGEPEPWPCLGIEFLDGTPDEIRLPSSFVVRGRNEGWIELVDEEVIHRPGGPPEEEWRVVHTFYHATALIFKTQDGDVRYSVVHLPDKYVDTRKFEPGDREPLPDISPSADAKKVTPEHYAKGETRVDHFYDLKLEA